jgi:type IV secretory pathway VirB2 component (pilin)
MTYAQSLFTTHERRVLALAAAFVLLLTPELAFAQADVENMAQTVLGLLTGTLAKTFATIGFVICGYLYLVGRTQVSTLISVIIGCFIVFGAGWLVDLISGA